MIVNPGPRQRGGITLNPLELTGHLKPHWTTTFKESLSHSISETTWGAASEWISSKLDPSKDIESARDYGRLISEDEFKSNYNTPGYNWHSRMTVTEADILQDISYDQIRHDLIMKNVNEDQTGWLASSLGFMAIQFTDPINFLPLAWIISKSTGYGKIFNLGKNKLQTSKWIRSEWKDQGAITSSINEISNMGSPIPFGMGPMRTTLAYGAEGTLIEGARQGVFYGRDAAMGKDFDTQSALLSVGLGFGIGSGFGAILDIHRAVAPEVRFSNLRNALFNKFSKDGDLSPVTNNIDLPDAQLRMPKSTDEVDIELTSTRKNKEAEINDSISPEDHERYKVLHTLGRRVLETAKKCHARFKGNA